MLAPELSSKATASPNQGGAKHMPASGQLSAAAPAAASEGQPGRAVRSSGTKARSHRGEPRDAGAPMTSPDAARSYAASYAVRGGISCVPYARMVSGVEVVGNGGTWWHNAAGLYQRGHRPESGSVLVFRASGGMRLGHVAVVERQVSAREITVQHANWEGPGIRKGTVMRNVTVVDVSDANDWTAVRVQVGHDAEVLGRTYPTYGFIFNRPEGPSVPRGPIMVRGPGGLEEVAEAPAPSSHLRFINTSVGGLGIEAAR